MVERSGFAVNLAQAVGTFVKWFIVLIFFAVALDILNLNQVSDYLLTAVIGYVPRVIVAAAILLGGIALSTFVQGLVAGAAESAGIQPARMLGKAAQMTVLAFVTLAALNELQIATELVQMLFAGIVFAASLATGLAFGLGGREAASQMITRAQTEAKM